MILFVVVVQKVTRGVMKRHNKQIKEVVLWEER
jgi:hypothetical protein